MNWKCIPHPDRRTAPKSPSRAFVSRGPSELVTRHRDGKKCHHLKQPSDFGTKGKLGLGGRFRGDRRCLAGTGKAGLPDLPAHWTVGDQQGAPTL